MSDVESSVPVLAVTAAVGAIVLLFVLLCGVGRRQEDESKNEEEEEEVVKETKKPAKPQAKKKEKPQGRKKDGKFTFSHQWLAGTLKGHSSPVLDLDFSPNGKYLASCAEDRSVLLWNVKDFTKKEHKSIRANVELDHSTRVCFSPDSKAFVVSLYNENTIRVIKMGKKDDGSIGNFTTAVEFPKGHDAEIINIGISSSGRFIMTCSKDTTIKIWDLKGEILAILDTHQMNNSYGAVSPCGRFVASSGFTPDVKVWEVCFDKSGNFKEVVRAFELKGHTAGVYSFSFTTNSNRMATVSKDGTWKLWNTDVEYKKNQDAKLLRSGDCVHTGPSLIAISPEGSAVAVATSHHISLYNTITTQCEQVIEDAHASPIHNLVFEPMGQFLVSSGDKNINVFHNVIGYRAQIMDLEQKQQTANNQAYRDRLVQQIEETRTKLKNVERS